MAYRTIDVHHLESVSLVNGPGRRAVLWVQGCSLACPGCFNPETHGRRTGQDYTVSQLMSWLVDTAREFQLDGLSISGGEPLQQWQAVYGLLQQIKDSLPDLTVLLFTGYTWDEIPVRVETELSRVTDVVLAGRYQAHQRVASGLIGSANKVPRFYTDRITPAQLQQTQKAEIILHPDGRFTFTGIDPVVMA